MVFGKNNNGLYQSLLLLVFIAAMLILYSFVYKKSAYLQSHFKDVPKVQHISYRLYSQFNRTNKQKIINAFKYNIEQEKAALFQAKLDSIKAFENYTGDNQLYFFIQALRNADKKTARIAYMGDSSIEGDLISMTLRKMLQAKFGGQGVGFVPITSQTAGFRTTIGHNFSSNWSYSSLVKPSKSSYPYGFSGEVFYPKIDSNQTDSLIVLNVKYTARQSKFPISKLIFGKSDSTYQKSNQLIFQSQKLPLNEDTLLQEIVLSNETLSSIELQFELNHSMPFYGMSFESNSGVLVDNYSSRSNSGIPLTKISSDILKAYDKIMDYDLLILQFGLNALSKDGEDTYGWYKYQMKRVIAHYKKAMPTTSILLVSVGDKSEKNEDGEMQTAACIQNMIHAQRETARESNIAFFDFYQAMGGENSMVKWVEELEQANKDYTHLNYKGSKIIADSLYQFLVSAYENYEENEME